MILEASWACEAATVRADGLIDISGGGLTKLWATSFPVQGRFTVFVRTRMDDPREARRFHQLKARILLDDVVIADPPPLPTPAFQVEEHGPTYVNTMLNLSLGLNHEGKLRVELVFDQDLRAPLIDIDVIEGLPPG